MRGLGWTVAALCAVVLGACQNVHRDPAVDAQVQTVFQQLKTGQFAALMPELVPELAQTASPGDFAKIRSYLPASAALERTELTTISRTANGSEQVSAVDQYRFASGTAEVETVLQRSGASAPWKLAGIHLQFASNAEVAANRFTLAGKTPGEYGFFFLLVGSIAAMVAALVKVIRARGLRRKWLWGILAFVGLCTLHMDWTTGQVAFEPLAVNLIGMGVFKLLGLHAHWVLSTTLPVGALLILFGVWGNPARARKPKPKAPPAAAPDAGPPAEP